MLLTNTFWIWNLKSTPKFWKRESYEDFVGFVAFVIRTGLLKASFVRWF